MSLLETMLLSTMAGVLSLAAVVWCVATQRYRRLAFRLNRIVPVKLSLAGTLDAAPNAAPLLYRALKNLDPAFASTNEALQHLGDRAGHLLLAVSLVRLIVFGGLAALCSVAVQDAFDNVFFAMAAFPFALLGQFSLLSAALRHAAKRRRGRTLIELGFCLDLLVVFLESGVNLLQSLKAVNEVCHNVAPLVSAPQKGLVADIESGASYDMALERWSERLGIPQAQPIAALFLQSLVHGTELGPQLRQIADDLTEKRILTARESIGIKATQLTVLMVVFFIPSILALVAGAPMFSLGQSFGDMP